SLPAPFPAPLSWRPPRRSVWPCRPAPVAAPAASSLRTSRRPAGRGRPMECEAPRDSAPRSMPATTTRGAVPLRVRRHTTDTSGSYDSSHSLVRLIGSGIADSELSVQQLFHELDALVFQDRGILFETAIQRQADLPGPRKHLRILDGRFVHQMVGADRRVPLNHVQGVAVEIPGLVEPALVVEAGHVDDARVASPVPARPSHPRVGGAGAALLHVDGA